MSGEDQFDVQTAMRVETEQIVQRLTDAIRSAPSIREQDELIEKIDEGKILYKDIPITPGFVVFKDPHIYGVALSILGRMLPGEKQNTRWTFDHENDHFNEARNNDVNDIMLGISFGADGVKEQADGSITWQNLEWVGFNALKLSDNLSASEKQNIRFRITHAPQHLSELDMRKKMFKR